MMPTFIIIGAPRSGTTSIYHYLRQHPQIVMSFIKETHFFAYLASRSLPMEVHPDVPWWAKTSDEYQALFHPKENALAIGESTPKYIYVPGVPAQIKAYLPDVRLICILRNPVQRAYSEYLKNIREGIERRSFEEAIGDELQNKSDVVESKNYYVRAGFYFRNLSRFLECFDRSQLTIYFYDDLLKSRLGFMQSMFRDLGVDPGFVPDTSVRFNHGGVPPIRRNFKMNFRKLLFLRIRSLLPAPINMLFYKFQMAMQDVVLQVPELPPATGLLLREIYTEDVHNLEGLTHKDLSAWAEI